jgi:glucose/arabinose dehydrogenase
MMRGSLLAVLFAVACGGEGASAAGDPLHGDRISAESTRQEPAAEGVQVRLREVASGLDSPIAIANAGDGSERLFITLQRGRVVILDGTRILPDPFLDIRTLVSCCGERGLLSVAFHPRYRTSGFFFVDYTDTNGDTVVARYSRSSDPNRADPESASVLLRVSQPFSNHNGGQLQFGPDGYLYIGMGDGGGGGDPGNRAQNLGTHLGKLLRIDVDAEAPYAVPGDNPFVGSPLARPEIWAYGLRNPWRFSFDRATGDLLIADVGQNRFEEVNFVPASSHGGENFGWPILEGLHCFSPQTGCLTAGLTLPIIEYEHEDGCSVTGGYRYRGTRYPEMRGVYFYGDYCSGKVWGAVEASGGAWTATELLDTTAAISTFGEDEEGEIYLADHGGRIYSLRGREVRTRPARR